MRAKILLLKIEDGSEPRAGSLKKLQCPEIVQVDDTRHSPRAIEYDHRRNLALLHQPQCGAGKFVRGNGYRIRGHALLRGELQYRSVPLLHEAAQIAIGNNSGEHAARVDTTVVIPRPLRLIS